jgi:hypothetical protein
VVLVGAALGSLNDRGFGLNLRSPATYLAVVLSILVGVAVGGAVGAVYRRLRHHPVEARPHALPAGLAVAAICVLISRLSSFVLFVFFGGITAGLRWYFSRREHGREGGEEKPAGPPPTAQGAAVASSSSEATVPAPATAAASATTGAPAPARRKRRDRPPADPANA